MNGYNIPSYLVLSSLPQMFVFYIHHTAFTLNYTNSSLEKILLLLITNTLFSLQSLQYVGPRGSKFTVWQKWRQLTLHAMLKQIHMKSHLGEF